MEGAHRGVLEGAVHLVESAVGTHLAVWAGAIRLEVREVVAHLEALAVADHPVELAGGIHLAVWGVDIQPEVAVPAEVVHLGELAAAVHPVAWEVGIHLEGSAVRIHQEPDGIHPEVAHLGALHPGVIRQAGHNIIGTISGTTVTGRGMGAPMLAGA